MSSRPFLRVATIAAAVLISATHAGAIDGDVERFIDKTVRALMAENDVPGMAVAVTTAGERVVRYYGVASRETGQKVDDGTIFEIGSLSKTFTATLGAWGEEQGALSLSDPVSKHLVALSGTAFDRINVLDLATYTAGGLPLQFPAEVTDETGTIAYFQGWRPAYAPGERRLYSNPSIGLFGHLAARAMGAPFDALMETRLFPALGLTRTYLRVPSERMGDYAFGYSKAGKPIRVLPGAFDAQAYGVKTTASDMLRFVEANIDGAGLDGALRRAIAATHVSYFAVGGMRQGLGWESYDDPDDLDALLAGNSVDVIMKPQPIARLDLAAPAPKNALYNKTGSTNGFGAYAAFVPSRAVGVVLLANRNYPIPSRIKAANAILSALAGKPGRPVR